VLRYYLIATVLVLGALAIGAAFYRPGQPLEVAAVQSTGSPSAPRSQAPSTLTPEPVTGEAPWALSAFPACFTQTERVRGPRSYVRSQLPAGLRAIPSGSSARSADCTVEVLADGLRLTRGQERLSVPRSRLYQAGGPPFGLFAPRELVLLHDGGGWWELRRYRTAAGSRIEVP
jgi:hypothetical protein